MADLLTVFELAAKSDATVNQIQNCVQRRWLIPTVPAKRRGMPNLFSEHHVAIARKYAEAQRKRRQLGQSLTVQFIGSTEIVPEQKGRQHMAAMIVVEFPGPMTKDQKEAVRLEVLEQFQDTAKPTVLVLSDGGKINAPVFQMSDREGWLGPVSARRTA